MNYYYGYPYTIENRSDCTKKLKVNGRGVVDAAPDMAILSAGAVTEDKNAQNAQNQNELIINRIINALMRSGIAREDIQTQTYTILPIYDYVEGKQIFSGYRATHILEIKIYDLTKTGSIINTVTENGANQINGVQFTLKNSAKYYNRALQLAMEDAAIKAQTIARTMKAVLDMHPCSVTEQSTSFSPLGEQGVMKLAAIDTVMPGRIQIIALIEAEYQYH